jgi:Polysaccharide lyase
MIQDWLRLALRRRHKMVVALGASAALALSGLSIESASAATRPSLALSLSPDRSGAVGLDGSTVKGKIYVFVKNSRNIGKVDFYLDGRWRTKPPVQTDTRAPFDFAGTAADGTALPYETTRLADGSHTIRAVLTWSDGTSSNRRWDFTVANRGATATTAASPTAPTTTPPATTTAAPTITTASTSPTTTTTAASSPSTTALATPSASATPTLSSPTSRPVASMITNSFETGNFKGWNLCQWNAGGSIRNDNCQTYSGTGEYPATVVNESAEHPQSARFELRNGDIPFGSTERAEIARPGGSGDSDVVEGDERWISFDLKFDSRWPVPDAGSDWTIFFQWHGSGSGSSPPVCFNIDTDDVIYLENPNESVVTPVGPVVRNQWQRWLVHIKFSDNAAIGYVDVTVDGARKVSHYSMKTMVPGEPSNYFKMGVYRDPVNTSTAILYYDNFSISK